MALSPDEQELLDLAVAALPGWFGRRDRDQEDLEMLAKMAGVQRTQLKHWLLTQSRIKTAVGATGGEPDWLDQHARDRGTRRQENEPDPELRERLRNPEDALTPAALKIGIQKILDAASVAGVFKLIELPRDGAWYIATIIQVTGLGGTFTKAGSVMTFVPDVAFPMRPFDELDHAAGIKEHRIDISAALSLGNDGNFVTTGLTINDGVTWTNAGGVAEVDASVVWKIERRDVFDVITDGWGHSFWNRGFRYSPRRVPGVVVLLPFGTSEETRLAVAEYIRQKKGASVKQLVTRREIP